MHLSPLSHFGASRRLCRLLFGLIALVLTAPQSAAALWDDAVGPDPGWKVSPWFDWVHTNGRGAGWAFHYNHGWLYPAGEDPNNLWMWDLQLGWWWTSRSQYPRVYSAREGGWLLFYKDTIGPRWFYNYPRKGWNSDVQLAASGAEHAQLVFTQEISSASIRPDYLITKLEADGEIHLIYRANKSESYNFRYEKFDAAGEFQWSSSVFTPNPDHGTLQIIPYTFQLSPDGTGYFLRLGRDSGNKIDYFEIILTDGETGQIRKRVEIRPADLGAPASVKDFIFSGVGHTSEGDFVALGTIGESFGWFAVVSKSGEIIRKGRIDSSHLVPPVHGGSLYSSVRVDSRGHIYYHDWGTEKLKVFDASGSPLAEWSVYDRNSSHPDISELMAMDSSGNGPENIYIVGADKIIRSYDPDGALRWESTITVDHLLGDASAGNLYAAVAVEVTAIDPAVRIYRLDASSGEVIWERTPRRRNRLVDNYPYGNNFIGETVGAVDLAGDLILAQVETLTRGYGVIHQRKYTSAPGAMDYGVSIESNLPFHPYISSAWLIDNSLPNLFSAKSAVRNLNEPATVQWKLGTSNIGLGWDLSYSFPPNYGSTYEMDLSVALTLGDGAGTDASAPLAIAKQSFDLRLLVGLWQADPVQNGYVNDNRIEFKSDGFGAYYLYDLLLHSYDRSGFKWRTQGSDRVYLAYESSGYVEVAEPAIIEYLSSSRLSIRAESSGGISSLTHYYRVTAP